jgi:hypothetical protein
MEGGLGPTPRPTTGLAWPRATGLGPLTCSFGAHGPPFILPVQAARSGSRIAGAFSGDAFEVGPGEVSAL